MMNDESREAFEKFIAMTCYDAIRETADNIPHEQALLIGNDSASRFMKIAFDAETDVDDTNVVDISRDAFENWYSRRMDISASFKIDEDGYYDDSAEQIAWRGWQACEQSKQADLDQLRAELEKAKTLIDAALCPCCDKSGAFYDGYGEVQQCQWCSEVADLTGDKQ